VNLLNVTSNLPNGRPNIRSAFKLADKAVDLSSVKVTINGAAVSSGFQISDGEVKFVAPPPMGAAIELEYDYALLKDRLLFKPLVLAPEFDPTDLLVKFNGLRATKDFVQLDRSIEGNWTVRPTDLALSEEDPFGIRATGGLEIQVYSVELE
jgi:hypothetical protein